jgi:outer membrane protein TolC
MSRPDVRAAYYQLRAADFEVSVARADRLPSLSLSARTAISSDDFSLAWGDWLTRLGTNFSAPLFDAGARKAEVERTRAVVDERLAEYTATVLEAIREVQDALANISGQEDRIAGLEDELRAAKQARDQARLRYLKGQSDYLNFVTQQRSVQTLQRNLVAARADLLSFQVALYRALGGGGGQEYS